MQPLALLVSVLHASASPAALLPESAPSSTLGILAIFKDEANVMTEWIEHYRAEGVTQFVLINDGSTDGGDEIARALLVDGKDGTVYESNPDLLQAEQYNAFVPKLTTDWMLIIDLDEFMYARPPSAGDGETTTLASYLRDSVDATPVGRSCDSIQVPWSLYGSSNATRHPVSAIESNLHRIARSEDQRGSINVKSLTRLAKLCPVAAAWVHTSAVGGHYCLPTDPPSVRTDVSFGCKEYSLVVNYKDWDLDDHVHVCAAHTA